MTWHSCDICGRRVKTTQRIIKCYEKDPDYVLICIVCRDDAEEKVLDDMRCIANNSRGKKCRGIRFTHKHSYCRTHWRNVNESEEQ